MLHGIWHVICRLIIECSTLLIVAPLAVIGWVRCFVVKPRTVAPSLVALTLALLLDVLMLINPWTNFQIIHEIPNDDDVQLFVEWQAISGVLTIAAISLSVFEKRIIDKVMTLCGSIILLVIHAAGTAIFLWGVSEPR